MGLEAGWLHDAFVSLSADRPVGMGIGAIPFASIDAWARRRGLSEWEFDRLERAIRTLDDAFRSHRANQPKKGARR